MASVFSRRFGWLPLLLLLLLATAIVLPGCGDDDDDDNDAADDDDDNDDATDDDAIDDDFVDDDDDDDTPDTVTVQVPADNAAGVETGLNVAPGDTLIVEAAGTVYLTTEHDPVGPDGVETECGVLCPLPEASWGALVGQIHSAATKAGKDCTLLFGSSFEGPAPCGGALWLLVNDFDYGDNSGFFTVTVTVVRPGDDDDDDGDDDDDDDDDDNDDDDDDDDDDTSGLVVERIYGGETGSDGGGIAVTSAGVAHLVAKRGGEVIHFSIAPDNAISEERIAANGFSPVVAMDADENLHVAYIEQNIDSESVIYATNRSGHWERAAVARGIDANPELSIAVDGDGFVHLGFIQDAPATWQDIITYATNRSGVWQTQTVVPMVDALAARWLDADAAGFVHLVYHRRNEGLYYVTNASGVWVSEALPVPGDTNGTASIAVGADGAAHVAYLDDNVVSHLWRTPSGWQIQQVDAGWSVNVPLEAKVDADGFFHIGYFETVNDRLRHATNRSGSWVVRESDQSVNCWRELHLGTDAAGRAYLSAYTVDEDDLWFVADLGDAWRVRQVDPGGDISYSLSIALDDNDQPHAGMINGAVYSDHVFHATKVGGTWRATVVEDGIDAWIEQDTAVDSAGRPHIAWQSEGEDVYYSVLKDNQWQTELLDNDTGVGYDMNLVLDADDNAHLLYANDWPYELFYATNKSGAWQIQEVDSLAYNPTTASLAIGTDGRPHVAYYMYGDLYYATYRWGQWRPEIVAVDSVRGDQMSLLLTGDNQPVIVYGEGNYPNLRVAKKQTVGWEIVVIDNQPYAGYQPHAAIDEDDHLHVVYGQWDSYNYDAYRLKYATDFSGQWRFAYVSDYDGTMPDVALDSTGLVHVSFMRDQAAWHATFPRGYAGDDDDDDDNDDDDNDDNDDDDNDDDDNDDDASPSPLSFELIDGGSPGATGTALAIHDGEPDYVVAQRAGYLYLHSRAGTLVTDQLLDFYSSEFDLVRDAAGNAHISYFDNVDSDLVYHYESAGTLYRVVLASEGDTGHATSIALDADEAVYISYADHTTNSVHVMTDRSGDWVDETVDASVGDCGATAITLDDAGNIHVLYNDYASRDVFYANDIGGAFNTPVLVVNGSTYLRFQHLALGVDSTGVACAAWEKFDDYYIAYAIEYGDNLGGVWTERWSYNTGQTPSLVVDADDAVHVSYFAGNTGELRLADTLGGGWQTQVIDADNVGFGSSLALDADGLRHIGYVDRRHHEVWLADETDTDWTYQPIDQAGAADQTQDISLAYVDDQNIHALYCKPPDGRLHYATNRTGTWQAQFFGEIGVNADRSVALAVDPYDGVHVAFFDAAADALYYGTDRSGDWEFEVIAVGQGLDADLAVGLNNVVHLVYSDHVNLNLWYAQDDGGGWTTQLIDGVSGGDNSLALDGAGNPHITYFNYGLSHATNASGAWVREVVDADLTRGRANQLVVDIDNTLHAFYFDDNDVDIVYATNKTGAWRNSILDSSQWLEPGISAARDAAGNMYVLYHDPYGFGAGLTMMTDRYGPWQKYRLFTSHIPYTHDLALGADGRLHLLHTGADAVWHNITAFAP